MYGFSGCNQCRGRYIVVQGFECMAGSHRAHMSNAFSHGLQYDQTGLYVGIVAANHNGQAAVHSLLDAAGYRSVDQFGACGADFRSQLARAHRLRSEEHTSELQSLMRISHAVFCYKKKNTKYHTSTT